VSGGFESCIVYASRTTAKVAVTRQEGASLRRWSAEVVAGQGAGEQSQTQTGGRVPGVKGSQVQILSARPKKPQVRGRFPFREAASRLVRPRLHTYFAHLLQRSTGRGLASEDVTGEPGRKQGRAPASGAFA